MTAKTRKAFVRMSTISTKPTKPIVFKVNPLRFHIGRLYIVRETMQLVFLYLAGKMLVITVAVLGLITGTSIGFNVALSRFESVPREHWAAVPTSIAIGTAFGMLLGLLGGAAMAWLFSPIIDLSLWKWLH